MIKLVSLEYFELLSKMLFKKIIVLLIIYFNKLFGYKLIKKEYEADNNKQINSQQK